MTSDKLTFAERREALESVAALLGDAVTIITAEVDAMARAEQRFAERSRRRDPKHARHG